MAEDGSDRGGEGMSRGQRAGFQAENPVTRVGGVLLRREVLADRWESSRRLAGEQETL